MAKIKSIKFYNFSKLSSATYISLSVKFYDVKNHLILMDFSNSKVITKTENYCETNEYIVQSNSSWSYGDMAFGCFQAFHIGNFNKGTSVPKIGYCWIPADQGSSDNFIKIEFKNATNFSNIEILHSYSSDYGFVTCEYCIEYSNLNTETHKFVSNGKSLPYSLDSMENSSYDQNVVNSWFDSINFNKTTSIYDTKIGYVETLDANNFRNISVNTVEKLKSLCVKPKDTFLSCLISFDKKQTWKVFDGANWNAVSNISPDNIILNGMEVDNLNKLDKNKLISGGFTGDLDFKIVMKTNDVNKTPSVTKIYIEYK